MYVVRCLLFVVCWLLLDACCLFVRCLLSIVCCFLLFVVRCLSFVVDCSLSFILCCVVACRSLWFARCLHVLDVG